MKFNLFKKGNTSNIIAIIALIIAFGGFYRDCLQDIRLNNQEYINNAMEHRPLLKVVGLPEINYKSKIRVNENVIKVDSLKSKYTLTNTGKTIAEIVVTVSTDTVSYNPTLREFVFDEQKRGILLNDSDYNSKTHIIHPGETTYVEVKQDVKFKLNNKFVLHVLVFYKNEIGNLYDTYIWTKCKIADEIKPVSVKIIDNEDALIYLDKKLISPIETADSYDVYGEQETKSFNKLRKQIINTHRNNF